MRLFYITFSMLLIASLLSSCKSNDKQIGIEPNPSIYGEWLEYVERLPSDPFGGVGYLYYVIARAADSSYAADMTTYRLLYDQECFQIRQYRLTKGTEEYVVQGDENIYILSNHLQIGEQVGKRWLIKSQIDVRKFGNSAKPCEEN